MKALTIRQPWAWAVAKGYKPIENRGWSTRYRGRLAIHAAKAWDDEAVEAVRFVRDLARTQGCELPERLADDMPYCGTGEVIAVANLVDVCSSAANDPGPVRCDCGPWAQPMSYHWRLGAVSVLATPVPARGRLSLWDWDGAA